ncbi:Na+/H+ antiporter NhaA [Sanguibacter sp. A247]|uniref:Na+/H+ antiporter NhaA n=1 Tax=unclassified Sanguibacter TaxID=2645534 RepID=UPI003FD8B2EE
MSDNRNNVLAEPVLGSRRNLADTLRAENTGAILLLIGAVIALLWANSPWKDAYATLSDVRLGPASLHLDLSLAQWATDGLLAIFFFVVGVELKREIVDGQLRKPATAIVPILAAVGGMAVPALVYTLTNLQAGGEAHGWAIPAATDIAFAVAVLTICGRGLPTALRVFLLTLAVVDDLLGIIVIALFYSDGLDMLMLAAALGVIAIFAVIVRRRGGAPWWILLPVGILAWGLMHASGVHATIAGVLLGFTVPALARASESTSLAERYEHVWRPISAGVAVPVFALFAAGVALDPAAISAAASTPAAQGVFLGLVIGKPLGIVVATWLLVTLTKARLDESMRWGDVIAVACVGGIGFTVALLIAELSFPAGSPSADAAKAAVLLGSLAAAALGGILLTIRGRAHRRQGAVQD